MSYTPTEWESTDVVTATRMNALEQAVGDMNMSYTPNTWSDGDILSAEKMNALEQAVASGGGGSSDFSTATVVVTFRGNIWAPMPYIEDNTAKSVAEGEDETKTFQAILYKGSCTVLGLNTISDVSGNASIVNDNLVITGDCAFSVSSLW